ncbi:MAG TPA: nucleoside deaminase [Acidimicrobiia bacterium]|nr:nucleoside deaminase [Acidimicrobiia bacterium]
MFSLPTWIDDVDDRPRPSPEDQARFAVDLARRNVVAATGGPFGAAVFEIESGDLVAVGVNLVLPTNTAIAHAEIVAIALAGQAVGSFDLGAEGLPDMVLACSCEPCAMCFGAVPWSGVRRLVTSATDADARAIGFDEGPKMSDWRSQLESRGIEVITGVVREEGAAVLHDYVDAGGLVYNGRGG